jgi:ectoine hydroxylase-related dioxygenase (phytanoyl-CoA dioxygenase family)
MALDDVDRHNGALSYIPGSQREGLRPHQASGVLGFSQSIPDYSEADRAREQLLEGLRPGDCICHHGETIHRAGANTTKDKDRRAFACVYKGESSRTNSQLHEAYMASLREQQAALKAKEQSNT